MKKSTVLSRVSTTGNAQPCMLGTATCQLHFYEATKASRVVPHDLLPNTLQWIFCLQATVYWNGQPLPAANHGLFESGAQPTGSVLTLLPQASALLLQIPLDVWQPTPNFPLATASEITPPISYPLLLLLSETSNLTHASTRLPYFIRTLITATTCSAPSATIRLPLEETQKIIQVEQQLLSFGAAIRSIQQLCSVLHIKSYKFNLLIKSIFNCTPQQWLVRLKMTYAVKLLHQNQFTIEFIAKQLQYQSDENFITAFKAHFGITPHVFRKQVKQLHVVPFSEIHAAPHLPVA